MLACSSISINLSLDNLQFLSRLKLSLIFNISAKSFKSRVGKRERQDGKMEGQDGHCPLKGLIVLVCNPLLLHFLTSLRHLKAESRNNYCSYNVVRMFNYFVVVRSSARVDLGKHF